MNGRFWGPCGGLRPAGGGNRVEVRVCTVFWFSRVAFPREGSPCPIPAASPVLPRGVRFWGCSPLSPASLCFHVEWQRRIPSQRTLRTSRLPSVNGQGGWKSAEPDQFECTPSVPMTRWLCRTRTTTAAWYPLSSENSRCGCRTKSRVPRVHHQTYSTPVTEPAGEDEVNKEYVARFLVHHNDAQPQPGLYMTVSPDSYEGSRMAWVSLEDTSNGTQLRFSDTPISTASRSITTAHCFLVGLHIRSSSGSSSTLARTTTWYESSSTVRTLVSASRRGRTTTEPLTSRRRRRTSISQPSSTASSSAPASLGLAAPTVATCSTTCLSLLTTALVHAAATT